MPMQRRRAAFWRPDIDDREAMRRELGLRRKTALRSILGYTGTDNIDDLALVRWKPLVQEGKIRAFDRLGARHTIFFHHLNGYLGDGFAAQARIHDWHTHTSGYLAALYGEFETGKRSPEGYDSSAQSVERANHPIEIAGVQTQKHFLEEDAALIPHTATTLTSHARHINLTSFGRR
jgi:hypothetical protein